MESYLTVFRNGTAAPGILPARAAVLAFPAGRRKDMFSARRPLNVETGTAGIPDPRRKLISAVSAEKSQLVLVAIPPAEVLPGPVANPRLA
jgi:hypothetical protein